VLTLLPPRMQFALAGSLVVLTSVSRPFVPLAPLIPLAPVAPMAPFAPLLPLHHVAGAADFARIEHAIRIAVDAGVDRLAAAGAIGTVRFVEHLHQRVQSVCCPALPLTPAAPEIPADPTAPLHRYWVLTTSAAASAPSRSVSGTGFDPRACSGAVWRLVLQRSPFTSTFAPLALATAGVTGSLWSPPPHALSSSERTNVAMGKWRGSHRVPH